MLLSDYTTQVQELIHDSSNLDFSQLELTNFINNARTRVALDFACVRTYFGGCSLTVGEESYPMNGAIGGALIGNGGGNYSAPPTVTFDPPSTSANYPIGQIPSEQATGVAIMSGTAPFMSVSQIAMTRWGAGYTVYPNVTFSPAGATAFPMFLQNVIDFHAVSYLYGVQRTMLQWKPWTYFNAYFRSNTTASGAPAVWSQIKEANVWWIYPQNPDQNYPIEIDAYVTPFPLVNTTDQEQQINAPMSDCVQYYAAHLALLKAQNFQQADYYNKKYEARRMQISATRDSVRRLNVYQSNYRRLQRGY